MLPILIILAAVGGLIVNHYTDNWLSEYTSRVYLNLNLDVYVSGSISVVKSTSSTLWNYSHSNGLTSAGQFVGPELVEIDLKEHWYLQGPPPVTAAPVIVSIPSESLGSYFNVLAVLLFLVMVGA